MNVLVIPETGSQLDPSILVGQSIARWSGDQWRVLHTLGVGFTSLVRGRAEAERARRMVQIIARPELPPTRHTITRRTLKSAVRRELHTSHVDLIVTNAHRASDRRHGGTLGELIEVFGGPTLAVRDMLGAQPRRVCVVTEPRDTEHDALQSAVSWILAVFGPSLDGQPGLPVEIDLVHVAATQLDWSVAQRRFAWQFERSLGDPRVIVTSGRPELSRHVPEALDRLRPHLVVVFQERRSGKNGHHFGKMARKIVNRSAYHDYVTWNAVCPSALFGVGAERVGCANEVQVVRGWIYCGIYGVLQADCSSSDRASVRAAADAAAVARI